VSFDRAFDGEQQPDDATPDLRLRRRREDRLVLLLRSGLGAPGRRNEGSRAEAAGVRAGDDIAG